MMSRKTALVLSAGLLSLLLPLFFLLQIERGAPEISELREIRHHQRSHIYSSDGELLGSWFLQNRTDIPIDAVPGHFLDALIAIEDERFYRHDGIDRRALVRVLVKSILLRQESGGGSTLTQQLAKNLFPRERGGLFALASDKIRESITARRIEKLYSKREILELYLNTVSFGEETFGLESASQRYFNRPASELELHQAALLAGLLRAPGAYNPRTNPQRALNRRNLVLRQMDRLGYLQPEEADAAISRPIGLDYRRHTINDGPAPHFREHLRVTLQRFLREQPASDGRHYNLYTDGLRIHTTIDSRLQQAAEAALELQITQLEEEKEAGNTMELNGSFVALSPHTGEVIAWVGGIDHAGSQFDHVTAGRQTGSAFKPIVYAAALENGIRPCDYRRNRLSNYEAWDEWTPRNVGDEYGGYWSIKAALAHSINTITVELIMEIGVEEVLAQAAGLGLEGLPAVPSIALGTGESSLLEMVSAYAVFASGGLEVEPVLIRSIRDSEGRELYRFDPPSAEERTPVLAPQTAAAMVSMLAAGVDQGTGSPLRTRYGVHGPLAGKTGTTQGYRGGWFVGFTPELVFGAWTGPVTPGDSFTGHSRYASRTALPVAGHFLSEVGSYPGSGLHYSSFHPFQTESGFVMACQDYRDDSLFDRFRDLVTGRNSDEPRQVRPPEERRGVFGRIRNLFGGN